MIVMEGISYARSDGTWQKIEVSLDDADFVRQARDWGFDPEAPISQSLRHTVLTTMAEALVFSRVAQARKHDDEWFAERDAWKQDVLGRLTALKKKVTQE